MAYGNGDGFTTTGVVSSSPAVGKSFILLNLASALCSSMKPMQINSTMTYIHAFNLFKINIQSTKYGCRL